MNRRLDCRNCNAPLRTTFVDLGVSPLSNSYVPLDKDRAMEPFYPLHAYVCERCFLVQLESFESREQIFEDYAYFSSFSDSWLDHSRRYVEIALDRLAIDPRDLVVEAASNDGYLLQYFAQAGRRVLGIEPARNVAAVARERGIATESVFLGKATGEDLVARYGKAKLVIANNVIAHVPDLHDFVSGLASMMDIGGTLTIEIPHLLKLMDGVEFDTIYHEHFSYYSLLTMENVLARHGLRIWDVDRLATHGGSLRYWVVRNNDDRKATGRVEEVRREESASGLNALEIYEAFAERVRVRKREILQFLIAAADEGKTVVGYGAPAKGNTLLNYCGIRSDLMAFTVDKNPAKQGTLLPGSRIPVYAPERLRDARPDYVLILPWNIRDEVVEQTSFIREWEARFVVAMPRLEIF